MQIWQKVLLGSVIWGLLGLAIAKWRGGWLRTGFLWGLFLGPLGVIIVFFDKPVTRKKHFTSRH